MTINLFLYLSREVNAWLFFHCSVLRSPTSSARVRILLSITRSPPSASSLTLCVFSAHRRARPRLAPSPLSPHDFPLLRLSYSLPHSRFAFLNGGTNTFPLPPFLLLLKLQPSSPLPLSPSLPLSLSVPGPQSVHAGCGLSLLRLL